MGYQSGTISPPPYHQDNSGKDSETLTSIVYTPEMFGAPPGSQIIVATVSQQVSLCRDGPAYVVNQNFNADSISFDVYTDKAGGFPIGHHSGCITVTTSFSWWYYSADAETKEGYEPSEEDALRMFIKQQK